MKWTVSPELREAWKDLLQATTRVSRLEPGTAEYTRARQIVKEARIKRDRLTGRGPVPEVKKEV